MYRYKSKKKAFTKASKKWQDDLGRKSIEKDLKKIVKYCKVVRVIAHTQVKTKTNKQKFTIYRLFFNQLVNKFSALSL